MLVHSGLLLLPLLAEVVSVTVPGPPGAVDITCLVDSRLGPFGVWSETPRDPRLRSFHRPLQVLVLHPEGLRDVLPPEAVPPLPVVLPPHPQPLDGGALAGLESLPTCCSSDIEERRRVRPASDTSDTGPGSARSDLSVSGVRVPSMSE